MPKMNLVCNCCGKHYEAWQRGKKLSFCSLKCRKEYQPLINIMISDSRQKNTELCDYAIYNGDEFLFMGDVNECANYLNILPSSVYKIVSQPERNLGLTIIKIEEEP